MDKILKKKQTKSTLSQFYLSDPTKTEKSRHSNNYIGNADNIWKYLTNDKKTIISVNKSNICALLVNSKERTDKINKSGVYETSCDNCTISFIGCTNRSFF